jgi:hypothetical protein
MMVLLLLQANPLTSIYQFGAATGSAIICTGLFIWSQVQMATFKSTVENTTSVITQSNSELKALVSQVSESQNKFTNSITKLAEAVKSQSDSQREEMQLIRDMAVEHKVLAANQMIITSGFQRVVEQLISVVHS